MSIVVHMHRNEQLNLAWGMSNDMASGQTMSGLTVTIWQGSTQKSATTTSVGFKVTSIAASTGILTDVDGKDHPAGQSITAVVKGTDALGAARDYEVRAQCTNASTNEVLIAQDAAGNAPIIRTKAFGEA